MEHRYSYRYSYRYVLYTRVLVGLLAVVTGQVAGDSRYVNKQVSAHQLIETAQTAAQNAVYHIERIALEVDHQVDIYKVYITDYAQKTKESLNKAGELLTKAVKTYSVYKRFEYCTEARKMVLQAELAILKCQYFVMQTTNNMQGDRESVLAYVAKVAVESVTLTSHAFKKAIDEVFKSVVQVA